jgi:predicted dehydrogenase/nucleoside-diphosphate-sugar epimerase
MNAIGYVILGGGSVTAEYYLPAMKTLSLSQRTTVADPSESSLAPLRREYPDVEFVQQDHRTLLDGLAGAETGRIIVALPNHLHVDAVEQSLSLGHHVLCEKPLSLKARDCARLGELAERSGVRLKIAMSRRYLPSLMLAREMVHAGELGKVTRVEVFDCAPFPWRPKSFAFFAPEAGGVLADMGVHYLDYLQLLLGALEPVSYEDDWRGGNESSLTYQLRSNEAPVLMRLSRLHPAGSFIRLLCERGEIRVEKRNERDIFVTRSGGLLRRVVAERPFANPAWPKDFRGSFCAMLEDFDAAVEGKDSQIAGAADAARTASLIEWAYNQRPAQSKSRAVASGKGTDALITGASGFIGGHLVERLVAEGRTIKAAVRSPASCANVARYSLEMSPVNLLDRPSVQNAVSGVRHVFHLAYGRDGPDAASVTIEGTKNLVEAAITAGAESIVILSTMYVFGFPAGGTPVDEGFPYRPYGGEYGTSKAQMERWCVARAKTSGKTRITVLNPTCVFGPGGGAYTVLPVDLARQNQFCWINGGEGLCNFTYVGNLVDAITAAAEIEAAHGQRFIISDGTMSWREFLTPLLAPLKMEFPDYSLENFKSLPRLGPTFRVKDLVSAALSAGEVRSVIKRSALARKLIDKVPPDHALRRPRAGQIESGTNSQVADQAYPPDWLLDLYNPSASVFSSAKAKKILQWSPAIRHAAASEETVRWLSDAGHYGSTAH